MIERILSQLEKVRRSGKSWTACCPVHDDRSPSLSIGYGEKGILLNCLAGCPSDAIVTALGLSWADLFYDGAGHDKTPLNITRIDPPLVGLQPWAQSLWDESQPLSGVALDYLKSRQCVIPPQDGDLRWHSSARHSSGYAGDALIALITHIKTAEPISLHRTWITSTGKADVSPSRMFAANHRAKDGVIRLFPDDWVTTGLGIAEGIETALSLAHEHQPVWAAISATNMGRLPVLGGIECLTIAVDADDAGRKAADDLSRRYHDAGVKVRHALVGRGDLNDHLEVRHG